MDYIFISALCFSLILNAVLGFLFYKKKHILTVDAQRLLSDIMAGDVTVNIKVIDASNLFYRSPKG